MVSSDFGKLEVMRHLMSGIDCAIAGDATAATAAPVAETFKKSRRFIKVFSVWRVFLKFAASLRRHAIFEVEPKRSGRAFNTEMASTKRNKGMATLLKRKSHGL